MAASWPQLKFQKFWLADGDFGIAQTINRMQQLAKGKEGVLHPQIRATAIEAARGVAQRDQAGERDAVFRWVKKNIEFRGEYEETIQTPLVTLQLRAGDCDDHSILLAALLMSLGHRVRFKTIAADRSNPTEFSHVYVEAFDRSTSSWVPLDTTVRSSYPGWQAPMRMRQRSWRPMMRGVGDDMLIPAPDVPLVPAPQAPSGLTPGQQVAYSLISPFAQAAASRIAFGQRWAPAPSVAAGLYGSTGLPTWIWVFGGGLLLIFAIRSLR